MRHFYTGLLFFGASVGAHAAELHKHGHAAKHTSATMHYTHYVPEVQKRDSGLYSDFKPASPAATPQLATSDYSAAALTQSQKDLVNVLSAVLYQRMRLQNAQMRLTLLPGAAVMETKHLQVAVRPDSTSVTWHRSF